MNFKPSPFTWICVAVLVGQLAAGVSIMLFGPTTPIPVHFNAEMVPDRWDDRQAVGWMVLTVALCSAVSLATVQILSRRIAAATGEGAKALPLVQVGGLLFSSGLCALFASLAFGAVEVGGRTLFAALCALFAVIGAWLGKAVPNPLVGVRTPWTMASRLAWDKSNRLAGRLFFWSGLAGLAAAPFVPTPVSFRLLPLGALVIAVLSVVESWRVWRFDPDRQRV